jgi:uncharacterized protein
MRIITLEEHVTFPELTALIPEETLRLHSIEHLPMIKRVARELADVDGERISSMDKNGISMQVLSVAGAGADLLPADEGADFAHLYNNAIAMRIAIHPGRFAAFAHLPMTNPDAAADELDRTVSTLGFKGAMINGLSRGIDGISRGINGLTRGQFLDHPGFAPLLQRAEGLKVPIYLHPGLPPRPVAEAYYSSLPKHAGDALAISGWGWHSETAIHVLRLIISGTLDKYPTLKLIIGHMGEMLPMMMARCDDKFGIDHAGVNQRSISQTLKDQVYITTSGVFTLPPFMIALETFGIDNILFSVDYPFSRNEDGRRFLDSLPLPAHAIQQIACLNAEKLLAPPLHLDFSIQ